MVGKVAKPFLPHPTIRLPSQGQWQGLGELKELGNSLGLVGWWENRFH